MTRNGAENPPPPSNNQNTRENLLKATTNSDDEQLEDMRLMLTTDLQGDDDIDPESSDTSSVPFLGDVQDAKFPFNDKESFPDSSNPEQ